MVMLHDPRLDRTTDGTGVIKEQNWYGYIENLRTKKAPHCAIPRMSDVLSYLKQQQNVDKGLYLVLDIKVSIVNAHSTENGILNFLQLAER